jgi:hypothetical protein
MIMRAIVAAILFISMATSAEESATAYLMTTSVSSTGNVSLLHIINTSSEVQNFTGTMYQGDGAQLGGSKVKLNTEPVQPNSRIVLSSPDLETLFSVGPWIGPSMIEVSGSSAFEVMIKLESPSGFVSNTNCVTSGAVHNIDGFDSTDDTFIRFINTGTSPISDIRGNLYNAAGENVGSSDVQLVSKLDPKEQIWINRDQLSQKFGATWTSEASLTVQAVDELKLLNLNFIDGRTFFNFSCFESSQNSQGGPDFPGPNQPTAPTGFVANGAYSTVNLMWDHAGYYGHAYTEIYRQNAKDGSGAYVAPNRAVATAAPMLANPAGKGYVDTVGNDKQYHYWIRFVSNTGAYSAWAGPRTTATAIDIDSVLGAINDSIINS